jgi:ABC-type multidrug transport system fused ATPase/permease subunit
MSERTPQNQVALLAFIAVSISIIRTLTSVYVTKKTLYFLSSRSATISAEIFSKLLRKDLIFLRSASQQEIIFYLTNGINTIVVQIIGSLTILVADLGVLIIILIGIFVLSPNMAIISIVYFALLGMILNYFLSRNSTKLSEQHTTLVIQTNNKLKEILDSFRELVVKGTPIFYINEFEKLRLSTSITYAKIALLPNISKYVFEIALLLGVVTIGAVQFLTLESSQAITNISVFMAASTRLGPAVLRIQQSLLTIHGSMGSANSILIFVKKIKQNDSQINNQIIGLYGEHSDTFLPEIKIQNLYFEYPEKNKTIFSNFNLEIKSNQIVAFIGTSGSGKTTLVDIILGLIKIKTGSIWISGRNPAEAILNWPGKISYIPQEIHIFSGTIRENLIYGYDRSQITDIKLMEVLEKADLKDFVDSLPQKLNTHIGSNGQNLSGGQKQRLGIARGLISKPEIIIMDEITNNLDKQSELNINSTIKKLNDEATIILITHKLPSEITFDQIIKL